MAHLCCLSASPCVAHIYICAVCPPLLVWYNRSVAHIRAVCHLLDWHKRYMSHFCANHSVLSERDGEVVCNTILVLLVDFF